jgi:hypothetical protein
MPGGGADSLVNARMIRTATAVFISFTGFYLTRPFLGISRFLFRTSIHKMEFRIAFRLTGTTEIRGSKRHGSVELRNQEKQLEESGRKIHKQIGSL